MQTAAAVAAAHETSAERQNDQSENVGARESEKMSHRTTRLRMHIAHSRRGKAEIATPHNRMRNNKFRRKQTNEMGMCACMCGLAARPLLFFIDLTQWRVPANVREETALSFSLLPLAF